MTLFKDRLRLVEMLTDAYGIKMLSHNIVAVVKIPVGARCVISEDPTQKCRTDKLVPISMYFMDKKGNCDISKTVGCSYYDYLRCKYVLNNPMKSYMDESLDKFCAEGLHFFRQNQPSSIFQKDFLNKNKGWGKIADQFLENFCKETKGFYVDKSYTKKYPYKILKTGKYFSHRA